MAGFTLSFGSMFSKTWRVHSIFTNVQLNKKVRQISKPLMIWQTANFFFVNALLFSHQNQAN